MVDTVGHVQFSLMPKIRILRFGWNFHREILDTLSGESRRVTTIFEHFLLNPVVKQFRISQECVRTLKIVSLVIKFRKANFSKAGSKISLSWKLGLNF